MPETTNGVPNAEGLFRGLAQAPIHLQNMVAELIDNALAAKPDDPEVWIDISPLASSGELYRLGVWDNGPGISLQKLKDEVLTLGFPPHSGSHLNEHGFGLKNVLSKAQRLSNKPWVFRTRDSSALASNLFYECQAPLSFKVPIRRAKAASWPAWAVKGTGTGVEVVLPLSYLQTVAAERRGRPPNDLDRVMEYLREHLGVFYRGYLEGGIRATAKIYTSIGKLSPNLVDPVAPDYASKKTYDATLTIGGKVHKFKLELGIVDKNSPKTNQRVYYYRHAPESQGIDVRIGRRVVATRLISQVWELDRHPTLNGIAGEILLDTADGLILPTLNNKTSIDFDSPLWHKVTGKAREKVPEDALPRGGGKSEDDLREELYVQIKGLAKPGDVVEKNYNCGNGVYVDIMWEQKSRGTELDIFEVKKGQGQPLNVYQLLMYWDALSEAGSQPTTGHLVSEGATPGVRSFISLLNRRKDGKGRAYNLISEDWASHGINP
jgi:hypothetical protein